MVRVRGPLLLAATALVLGAGAGVGASRADDHAESARQADRRADAVEVVQLRTSLERTHLDEANVRLLAALFDQATPDEVSAAERERTAARERAIARLEQLAAGDGAPARKAGDVLSAVRNDGIDDLRPAEVTPDLLTYAADLDLSIGASSYNGPATEVRSDLDDLARVASPGGWILNRAVDQQYLAERPPAPDGLADYLDLVEQFGPTGGLLATGSDDPLIESTLLLEEPEAAAAPSLRQVQGLVVRSPVAGYDAWLTDAAQRGAAAGAAPAALGALARQAGTLDRSVRGAIDQHLGRERSAAADAADAADARASRAATVALVLGLAAAAAAVAALGLVLVRAQRDALRATTDPLTGVGNRHLLADATVAWLADEDLSWHLLAMVDLDRFKLVNDTWGHAAGDAVLVRIARELQGVVADLRAEHDGLRGAVVRMGGDEFLVSLHGTEALDVGNVHRRLDEVRAATLRLADGTAVPLRFSIGIATATGHPALDDLERAADLASYEDKAARAQRADDPVSPPTPVGVDAASSSR